MFLSPKRNPPQPANFNGSPFPSFGAVNQCFTFSAYEDNGLTGHQGLEQCIPVIDGFHITKYNTYTITLCTFSNVTIVRNLQTYIQKSITYKKFRKKLALTYDTIQRIIYSANFGATKR